MYKPNNANPKRINQINHKNIIQGKGDNAYLLNNKFLLKRLCLKYLISSFTM